MKKEDSADLKLLNNRELESMKLGLISYREGIIDFCDLIENQKNICLDMCNKKIKECDEELKNISFKNLYNK